MTSCSTTRWSVLLASAAACGSSSESKPAAGGVGSSAEVGAAIKEAMALGASTWPEAKVSGVFVGPEAVELERSGGKVRLQNVYTVRVSFEFDVDPTDATARSGSVVCAPACRVIRHKVKGTAAPPWPCAFEDALAAAEAAGVHAKQPLVGYGSWAYDLATKQRWSGWTFRADKTAPVVEIGEGCRATH